tara:strand:+ start:8972 stop:9679 length:708 start_codon:yes stop_codon:yes gene_type:complete
MIDLKVGEIDCKIPNQWNEITLNDYSKLFKVIKTNQFIEPTDEDMLNMNQSDISTLNKERDIHNIRVNRNVFSQLTGIDKQTINQVNADEMADTLLLMTNFLNGDVEKMEFKEDKKESFKLKGEEYFFPTAQMKTSTFGDFIETAQLEMLTEKNESGKFGVIAEQMAILCRKENEIYDEQLVVKKTKMFGSLKMNVVWDFLFFLRTQINIYKTNSLMFLKMAAEQKTDMQPTIGK